MAESILKECGDNLTGRPQYYLMDAGYDHKALYELIRKRYRAQAIIPLNHRRAKEPKEKALTGMVHLFAPPGTAWSIGAAVKGLTSSVARILWANAIAPLVLPVALTVIMV